MPITKRIGHGAQVLVDHDSDATYTAIEGIVKITPPASAREDVDMTTLDSTIEDYDVSDPPNVGELTFEHMWHPNNANPEMLDTLFANKSNVNWKVVFPFATPVNKVFSGRIKNLTPADLASKEPIKRTCVVRLTSAVTTS